MDIRRYVGQFRLDRVLVGILVLLAAAVAALVWLDENPQHNPWAPLDLRDPPGRATAMKLVTLRAEPQQCRAVLARSQVAFETLAPAGEGPCRREDRVIVDGLVMSPQTPATTCAIGAAAHHWLVRSVKPAAREILGSDLSKVEHFGAYSCRRLYGRGTGGWSEHATGNALDIAAFVLADGRRIALIDAWGGEGAEAKFLRAVRDDACAIFGTVLSPDYNSAHRDHFHFDQARRGYRGVCR
ncbi:extensin family protein [Altererythrobacter aquiaggeris]|uniref:extensin-like domain-containing protein n=1 Tax=Aestuarierythrobacter aquiaggeris TaxID=1898396 RepID=UPI003016571D